MKTDLHGERGLLNASIVDGMERDYLAGLRSDPKTLPCKYLYDQLGSQLFDQICELDEYYPTRTERGILEAEIQEIAALAGQEVLLVEFGSGNSSKTELLLDALVCPVGYVPIDISSTHLHEAVERLERRYPELGILPVSADYNAPFALPEPARAARCRMIFFPGSTIGNFKPLEARQFLKRLASHFEEGDLFLIGVDLVKDSRVLERAYNDRAGVTAAFNLNLLHRANQELGANFDLQQFRHRAVFNEEQSRIEMHIVSKCCQTVDLGGEAIRFKAGEAIITEYSYKYRVKDFQEFAGHSGWRPVHVWTDPRKWFGVHLLQRR